MKRRKTYRRPPTDINRSGLIWVSRETYDKEIARLNAEADKQAKTTPPSDVSPPAPLEDYVPDL